MEESNLSTDEREAFHQANHATEISDEIKQLAISASKKLESFVQMYIDESNLIKAIVEGAEMKTLEGEELKEFESNLEGLKELMKNRDEIIADILSSDDFHPDFKKFIKQNQETCHGNMSRLVSIMKRWSDREEAIKQLEEKD